jgi:hypothetical protein
LISIIASFSPVNPHCFFASKVLGIKKASLHSKILSHPSTPIFKHNIYTHITKACLSPHQNHENAILNRSDHPLRQSGHFLSLQERQFGLCSSALDTAQCCDVSVDGVANLNCDSRTSTSPSPFPPPTSSQKTKLT